MTIPTPDSISNEWFTQQLQRAGFQGAEVAGFRQTRIGTGQVGKCIRYEFDYLSKNRDAPATLIGKFPSDDADSRATGVALRNYFLETRFYQQLAQELSIRTPRCYYADIVGNGPEFALLLEDLSPARQGDQIAGCTQAVARAALQQLVGLQVPYWCDQRLQALDWLSAPADESGIDVASLYQQLLPGFVHRYRDQLDAAQIDIFTRFGNALSTELLAPTDDLFCLEHVDFRLDNMMIDGAGSAPTIAVVDWQTLKIGRPLNDVAYFLGAGLAPALRCEVERELVSGYHRDLEQAGVQNLDFQRCWEEYRRSSLSGFGITVIASMLVGQTDRGDSMFLTMADRHSRHALDLNASEFLV